MAEGQDGADVQLVVRMSSAQALEFVERLGGDDEFRSRLEREPHVVLQEFGIHVSREVLPETIVLPEKHEVKARLQSDAHVMKKFMPTFGEVCGLLFPEQSA